MVDLFIGIIILLFIIGMFSSQKGLANGAEKIKEGLATLTQPSPKAYDEKLIALLECLYIDGYIFGEAAAGASRETPAIVTHTGLSAMLHELSANTSLEQALPRIGFSIRSTASCSDLSFSRQYARMLITPSHYAIGYIPS